MSALPVVFVTGATGVVGAALVRALAGQATLRALVRHSGAVLPDGVEAVIGDLDDTAALHRGVDGADAVVHLAAQLHVNDPSPELSDLYRRVNTEGTRRIASLAGQAKVSRVVFASTINVYGPSEGRAPWTEMDAPQPETLYARTKLDAEGSVLALDGGVVFRLAAVYGPGMKGNYPSLARLLARGLRVLPGDGTNRRTLIHVEDAAQALALAATGAVPPGLYNLTDGSVHAFDAIIESLQHALAIRAGMRYASVRWLHPLLTPVEAGARLAGKRFPARALLDKLVEDVAVSGDLLLDRSSYTPRYSTLQAGWLASGLGPEAL